MQTENEKQPAFPSENKNNSDHKGLSKREYFAAMALQGILANPAPEIMQSEIPLENMAVQLADALLKQLNK